MLVVIISGGYLENKGNCGKVLLVSSLLSIVRKFPAYNSVLVEGRISVIAGE